MDFVSYPHLIFLISGQTFEVTVAQEKNLELNGPLDEKVPSSPAPIHHHSS
jgi:hypothetical protein